MITGRTANYEFYKKVIFADYNASQNQNGFLECPSWGKNLENHTLQGLLAFFSPSVSHMKVCQNPMCYIKGPQTLWLRKRPQGVLICMTHHPTLLMRNVQFSFHKWENKANLPQNRLKEMPQITIRLHGMVLWSHTDLTLSHTFFNSLFPHSKI